MHNGCAGTAGVRLARATRQIESRAERGRELRTSTASSQACRRCSCRGRVQGPWLMRTQVGIREASCCCFVFKVCASQTRIKCCIGYVPHSLCPAAAAAALCWAGGVWELVSARPRASTGASAGTGLGPHRQDWAAFRDALLL